MIYELLFTLEYQIWYAVFREESKK